MVVSPFLSLLRMAGRGGWARIGKGRPDDAPMSCPSRVAGSPFLSMWPVTEQSFLHPTKAGEYNKDVSRTCWGHREMGLGWMRMEMQHSQGAGHRQLRHGWFQLPFEG